MANIIHNNIIRKITLAFGNIFSQIPLVRYNENSEEVERYIVSIIYASKEQYAHRLMDDPELDTRVQIVIPSLSYEMMGMTYDASRKQNTNVKNYNQSADGLFSQFNPVPYNFDFDLSLYSRTFEDAHQIVEHILSYFAPDYTIKVNLVPQMGIVKELPILLNSVDRDVEYEGDREATSRRIIFTFHFTVKGFIFGKITDVSNKLITHSITNIYNTLEVDNSYIFDLDPTGSGNYKIGEIVYQGFSRATATSSAEVIAYNNTYKTLQLKDLQGNFVSNLPIIGSKSLAKYTFTSYTPTSNTKASTIDVRVNPVGANVSSNWTANTIITNYS